LSNLARIQHDTRTFNNRSKTDGSELSRKNNVKMKLKQKSDKHKKMKSSQSLWRRCSETGSSSISSGRKDLWNRWVLSLERQSKWVMKLGWIIKMLII